ncbi:beta-ketoacyl synthase chain length factor [Actinobacillus genomosp. 1]|uniref:beta-ketoacyl synthase chain length factor n=1 Tax=Actinobacillus genomosp. 1 TaxID=254839 RepID=UPI002441BE8E|nr:beta-ketoacyl synthase chain length factor [Actinobacillus genomosp. 1]WGE91016.1 beta-ketoacyl synthase chain length factor [Actinobacillus genomosp. 1]
MTDHCEFTFNISAWNVVANKQLSIADWQLGEAHWVKNAKNWEDFIPKLAFLPAIKRRRLSDSARLFFEAAWELLPSEQANIPVVYASNNSEINRSFGLWHTLLQDGDVSPTSFSLSVHNALVGQWSEFRQVTAETISITASQDNLESALLEAYLLLNDGADRVLVVVAESPLLENYNAQPIERQPFAYALALVVTKGEQYQLSLVAKDSVNTTACLAKDNALTWVQNHYTNSVQWQTKSTNGKVWQWRKN